MFIVKIIPQSKTYHLMSIYRYGKIAQLSTFYIPSKREKHGIQLRMVCENDTGYLLRFIIYIGASTVYQEPTEELSERFDGLFKSIRSSSVIVM